MARKKKTPSPTPSLPELDAIRHKETRKNIPTEELRDFVADDEMKPPKMLYPRDPSLDPQLVWKGKDEQDRERLEVDIVPIYVQEVTEPRVIVEAVQARKSAKPDNAGFLPGSETKGGKQKETGNKRRQPPNLEKTKRTFRATRNFLWLLDKRICLRYV